MSSTGPDERPGFLKRSRLLHILGGYLAVAFGALQVVDMFVDRLPVPDWLFVAVLVLLVIGGVVIALTAFVQARGSGSVRAWLTWRRALAGGAGTFGVLVLAVVAFMGMRALGVGPLASLVAAGVLDRSERILLSDFQSQTGDTDLAGAVTEAFRVDFEQSRIVSLVEPGHVRDALGRMQRPTDAPLQPALARELAQREGIKAVLTGEINTAGRTFIVSARLVTADTDSVLVSLRETARDSAAIIAAIDRLSSRMRERIGESLVAIRGSDRLEQVTTASLPALRRYSQAVRALEIEGDATRGITLLEEAIALDSMFAMAHRKLGVALSNDGQPRERWAPAYTRAFELSERLTDRERYYAQAAYYRYVQSDVERAIIAYTGLLDGYPNETAALNNLAVLRTERGEREEAVDLYRRALALDPHRPLYYTNLISSLYPLGRGSEARSLFEDFERRFPDHRQLPFLRAAFAYNDGDLDGAAAQFAEVGRTARESAQRAAAELSLGSIALLRGRIREARQHMLRGTDLLGVPDAWKEVRQAGFDLQVALELHGDTTATLRLAERFVRDGRIFEADQTGTALLEAAQFYIAAGQLGRARDFIARYDRLPLSDELRNSGRIARRTASAQLAIASGEHERGFAELRRLVDENPCDACVHLMLGRAWEDAARPDSAIFHLEQYVTAPWLYRLELDARSLVRVHERLAALHAGRGDVEREIYHLARFSELWADADPELQPRVEAARRRIAALRRGSS